MTLDARARQIHERLVNTEIGHEYAGDLTLRDRGYLLQMYRKNPDGGNFGLGAIHQVPVDADIIERFGLDMLGPNKDEPPKCGDLTVLTKRLGQLGLLIHMNGSTLFRLSSRGMEIARELENDAEAS